MGERTPWFPIYLNPVRFGWYEYRMWRAGYTRAFWTGSCWLEPARGSECLEELLPFNGDDWRGLTNPAKERA